MPVFIQTEELKSSDLHRKILMTAPMLMVSWLSVL